MPHRQGRGELGERMVLGAGERGYEMASYSNQDHKQPCICDANSHTQLGGYVGVD